MSVYKHKKSPVWQFDFQLNNYRFSGSTNVATSKPKREAEAVEAEERRQAERLVEEIRRSGRAPMTLKRACDRWWDEVGQHGKETDLKRLLGWLSNEIGPDKLLHAITTDDVTKAVAARRRHTIKAGHDENGTQLYRPIMPRTVNRTVPILLKRVIRRARDNWDVVIFKEPTWKKTKIAEVKRPIREISLSEEDAIVAEEGCYYAIRRLTTIMGLRKSQSLLTWPQVDFENAVIRVIGQKGGDPRLVPMTREAYEILWAERGRHPTWVFTYVAQRNWKPMRRAPDGLIAGERYPVTYAGLTSHHRRAWARAGVKARFHDLRHTAGMRTLRSTGNLKVTQKLLGHSEIATTSKFYVDAMVDDVREAMETTAQKIDSRRESRTSDATPINALKKK